MFLYVSKSLTNTEGFFRTKLMARKTCCSKDNDLYSFEEGEMSTGLEREVRGVKNALNDMSESKF